MKRDFLMLLIALPIAFASFGQSKIKSNKPSKAAIHLEQLVGTWRLVEFADLDSTTHAWTYAYGKNPLGYFTYTKSGIVNLY